MECYNNPITRLEIGHEGGHGTGHRIGHRTMHENGHNTGHEKEHEMHDLLTITTIPQEFNISTLGYPKAEC